MTARPLTPPFLGSLALVCVKCTREGKFAGKDRTESAQQAIRKGWTMPSEGRFNCPRCAKVFGVAPKERVEIIHADEALDIIMGGPGEFERTVREVVHEVCGTKGAA